MADAVDPLLLPTEAQPPSLRYQHLWNDSNHWSGPLYFSKRDARLFVPKRSRWSWGWTVNLGHAGGPWVLLGLVVGIPLLAALGASGVYASSACKKA